MHAARPLHLGLTGNIASGKSTVTSRLRALGATVIDADQLARDAVASGSAGLAAVVRRFGAGVLETDGTLNRPALGRLVFADSNARRDLNAIVHPLVGQLSDDALAAATARNDAVVISDIPLLFEVGLEPNFDGIILVDAPENVRRERLIRDRGLSESEANARIESQWPSERKRAGATWVIDNDGARDQLQERVRTLWRAILTMAERRRTASSP